MITHLFLDIGGVLLTDGWGLESRKLAAIKFAIDFDEMEIRHYQTFGTYELDKLNISEYLKRVVFYENRKFTQAEFQDFMFAQSKPYTEMIDLVIKLKAKYGLKTVVVSNEARELNSHRIKKFKLDEFVDFYISSCYVHLRKPDTDIFRLALDTSQAVAAQVVYIENTPLFITIAESLGIQGILHTDYKTTKAKLKTLGLELTI